MNMMDERTRNLIFEINKISAAIHNPAFEKAMRLQSLIANIHNATYPFKRNNYVEPELLEPSPKKPQWALLPQPPELDTTGIRGFNFEECSPCRDTIDFFKSLDDSDKLKFIGIIVDFWILCQYY